MHIMWIKLTVNWQLGYFKIILGDRKVHLIEESPMYTHTHTLIIHPYDCVTEFASSERNQRAFSKVNMFSAGLVVWEPWEYYNMWFAFQNNINKQRNSQLNCISDGLHERQWS